jgi:signal transduction histidine kinase
MTILTLSENKDSINSYVEESNIYIKDSQKTINALTHLVSVTTQELYKLNEVLQYNIEEEVRKNREKDKQLLQQSRLAQMGELISMIAHQWRQPLSAIGGAAAGLKVKAQLQKINNDMVVDICDKILYSSEHLSSTIDDFRTFYKSNKETQELNFNEIISGVLNIVKIAIESKNIRLEVDIQNNEIIRSYHNEIKQVIMNLIKNAEDALLEKNIENPYIKILAYKDGDEFTIEVKDNAGGIDESIQEKIFDPYFSTKDKNGTGLGLYMSKTIIENHCQGKLYVKNDDDGAVFTIKIKNL